MTTKWGTTDRVYYCEIHDSLVRKWSSDVSDDPQCDWAVASQIPSIVEPCSVEVMLLVRPESDPNPHSLGHLLGG